MLLLDAVKERFEFPDLRREALKLYKYWEPEIVLIEAKAAGLPLIYELKEYGNSLLFPLHPSRGNDKHSQSEFGITVF